MLKNTHMHKTHTIQKTKYKKTTHTRQYKNTRNTTHTKKQNIDKTQAILQTLKYKKYCKHPQQYIQKFYKNTTNTKI